MNFDRKSHLEPHNMVTPEEGSGTDGHVFYALHQPPVILGGAFVRHFRAPQPNKRLQPSGVIVPRSMSLG
ncbi:hypothetical protein SKAU_G00337400 [Synaphobranchus kaupii]|uniref:Uncharacterized protein n=1 Tax=Synaphobranchus kaupii TaxID=118154 RepID=A0A9Q1EM99_SYNKA|nr:hypothetical protein SKAU_G00337400 [Synaphobranchus kaupii]